MIQLNCVELEKGTSRVITRTSEAGGRERKGRARSFEFYTLKREPRCIVDKEGN